MSCPSFHPSTISTNSTNGHQSIFCNWAFGAMQCSPLPLVLCRSTSLHSTPLHSTMFHSTPLPKRVHDPVGRPPPGNQHREAVDDEQHVRLRQHDAASVALDAQDRLQDRHVSHQRVRPGRTPGQQQCRRHPRLDRFRQRLFGRAIRRVVVGKGPVDPPGNQPAGAEGDAGGSLRAQQRPPVVEEGLAGADLQGVVHGGVAKGNVRIGGQIDPDRGLELDHVVEGIELVDGLGDGPLGVLQEAPDDGVVDRVAGKGVEKERENVPRHDELVLGWGR
mmetsp:Transcript_17766/g.49222  ORF Transcript_17766/g.49222 Transcript_17766/m.49222 type:complete len:276 (-) Transcript_17766:616-1443(-)